LNMKRIINAKELRATLPEIVRRTRRGERFVVLYRSRPAFQVVPVEDDVGSARLPVEEDPLFGAEAVGRSTDGLAARDHDRVLYGTRR
jgi:prevent-host-death family protein